MRWRLLAACIVLASAASRARADEVDDKLAAITNDPAIKVDDPKARTIAAALMAEGVKQLQAQSYDQALANFLEAYSKFPSPKILLNIASTLAEMGRLADAANTYQRYLTDPATGPERIAEVKQVLVDLDTKLTLLTVRVQPKGSEVSIDAGPFVAVGSALVTRVRPGIHLVRVRNRLATGETTLNGFEGEAKDIVVAAIAPVSQGNDTTTPPEPPPPPPPVAEEVNGWLVDGRRYATDDATGNERHVRATFSGPEVKAVIPALAFEPDDSDIIVQPVVAERRISSGVAGGLGFALAPTDAIELELDVLKSNIWGAYAGIRMRFLTGWVRPYAGGGVPMFFFENEQNMQNTAVFGVRGAGGAELRINGHLSVQADVGFEHFFNVEDKLLGGKRPEANVFVPTVGVIGRL
jgi:hypothetical protein